MMTREQMIAELEWQYQQATDEQRSRPLVQEGNRTWNLIQIMEQVYLKTDVAMNFVDNMIKSYSRSQN